MDLKIERDIPFPNHTGKELVSTLMTLKDGDSVYLDYQQFTKTIVLNAIANVRNRMIAKGVCLKTVAERDGKRVWCLKNNNL